jgi:hypothetical protein
MGEPSAVSTEEELVAALLALGRERLIGIDGLKLAGKSHIANKLGESLGWRVLHCDDFIRYGALPYPAILDLPALAEAINSSCETPTLLDGILMGVVLKALSMQSAPFFYVRRREPSGAFSQPAYYENFDPDTMATEAREEYLLVGATEDEQMLECEIIRYHQQYDPLRKALLVFENVASS